MRFSIRQRVKNLFQPGEGLYQRTVRSGAWAFALRITTQLFNIARLIILARVLAPDDFGLLGIALLAMMTLEAFSQAGFQQALIQQKEDIKDYLDAAWTVMLLRSLVLFAVLFFAAPYVATFFEAPQATTIIQVIGISLLLGGVGGVGGFVNIGVLYFQKELEFNKEFIYRASGTLADFVVAVAAVLILKSVWALVFGLLAGAVVRLIVSYFIHPYRPHLSSDWGKARELFGFGRWILGSSILVFLITQGDDIFVGKLLGVTMLGFYQMAYLISNAPATEITHVISQVTFPAYSKLQDNLPGLREGFLKTLQLTAFMSIPLAGGIFILAPEFTTIFLGEKWMPMVPAMQALALAGLVRSIGAAIGPVFYAVGKPEIVTRWQPVRLAVLAALIYPFTAKWGILGTSIAVFLSNLASTIGFSVKVVDITKCRAKFFAKKIILPSISASIMILLIFLLKSGIKGAGILEFVLLIGVGILIYIGTTYILDRQTISTVKQLLSTGKR
jgi:lipopolysaccharide exporter